MRTPFGARFWSEGAYAFVILSAALFVVATVPAMALYPGGSFTDHTTVGYTFSRNFFSDLGMLTGHDGRANTVSMVLFFCALTLVGASQVLFFLAFPRLFAAEARARTWSRVGSAFGIVAGLCFIGVACTPADILLDLHIAFVKFAFRAFPIAAFCYAVAIFRSADYPRAYAWVFVAFGCALVGYVLLLEFGPTITTDEGLAIQVGGQKVIAFGSIASVLVQAVGARRRAVAVASRARTETARAA
ncbi:MAG: hypothetical protein HY275_11010 [Gemmatimonadetes bacterium]|nr:hypothetical protein [Gemmatimonadota bacterium]